MDLGINSIISRLLKEHFEIDDEAFEVVVILKMTHGYCTHDLMTEFLLKLAYPIRLFVW